jgi:molybdopterin biosynthesis enzyme
MPQELRASQRILRLTPVADVLARIDALVAPVSARLVDLADALGGTLAGDVRIEQGRPRSPVALRDGWAVRSSLTTDAGPYTLAPLPAAARIDTGEPLPPEADAVAALEAVAVQTGSIQALCPINPGEGVLAAGGDVPSGAILAHAGRRLGRFELALLRSADVGQVALRLPRIALRRARSRADRIIDTAIECLAHGISDSGGVALLGGGNETVEQTLGSADCDAVVAVGGTGCGEGDCAVMSLRAVGNVAAHGIGLVPGETAAFGTAGSRPVLLAPGRLDAALAVWHLLGRALLARLCGVTPPPCVSRARLTRKVASAAGLAELVPVVCADGFATPLASAYLPIGALAQANGWLLVGPESEGFQAQSDVEIRPWP